MAFIKFYVKSNMFAM